MILRILLWPLRIALEVLAGLLGLAIYYGLPPIAYYGCATGVFWVAALFWGGEELPPLLSGLCLLVSFLVTLSVLGSCAGWLFGSGGSVTQTGLRRERERRLEDRRP